MTLEPLLTVPNLLAVLIAVAGGVVRGYTGFGSGLVMIPLLSLMWHPVDAIVTTTGLGAVAALLLTFQALPLTSWKDTGPMVASAILITPLGTLVLISFDADIVKKLIAVFVLLAALISLFGYEYKGPRGIIPSFIAGGMASVINGIAGVGGPPSVLYLVSLPDEPKVQRANIVIIMAAMGLSVLGYTIASGKVGGHVFMNVVLLAAPYALSIWTGAYLFKVLPAKAFKITVLWMLMGISIAMLVA